MFLTSLRGGKASDFRLSSRTHRVRTVCARSVFSINPVLQISPQTKRKGKPQQNISHTCLILHEKRWSELISERLPESLLSFSPRRKTRLFPPADSLRECTSGCLCIRVFTSVINGVSRKMSDRALSVRRKRLMHRWTHTIKATKRCRCLGESHNEGRNWSWSTSGPVDLLSFLTHTKMMTNVKVLEVERWKDTGGTTACLFLSWKI